MGLLAAGRGLWVGRAQPWHREETEPLPPPRVSATSVCSVTSPGTLGIAWPCARVSQPGVRARKVHV